MQRKFVREENPPSEKFLRNFQKWLDRNPALDEAAVLEEDKAVDYSQKGTIGGENDSSGDHDGAGNISDLIGGHYIDPQNPMYNCDGFCNYEPELYSPSSLPDDNPNENLEWDTQHGKTVASLLETAQGVD